MRELPFLDRPRRLPGRTAIDRPRRLSGRAARAYNSEISGLADFLDADQVARGVAEGAVADAVRLVRRLLYDLRVARLQLFEGAVEIGSGQQNPAIGALRHHLENGAPLVLGDPGIDGLRLQQDG